jgi:hypothetical protein
VAVVDQCGQVDGSAGEDDFDTLLAPQRYAFHTRIIRESRTYLIEFALLTPRGDVRPGTW